MKLTILLPTYEYKDGIIRILEKLSNYKGSEVELIISDDSTSNNVYDEFIRLRDSILFPVVYKRNNNKNGAVFNWNLLFESANGEYLMHLHHDDYPLSDSFIEDVLSLLSKNDIYDVYVLRCILKSKYSFYRMHFSAFFQKIILNNFPEYIFHRNVIGPPSCLILRNNSELRYDEKLCWLVDVDFYYKLRKYFKNWKYVYNISIVSILNNNNSITYRLGKAKSSIKKKELIYLFNKIQKNKFSIFTNRLHILSLTESIFWYILRLADLCYSCFIEINNQKINK